jgi:hypothetical protein
MSGSRPRLVLVTRRTPLELLLERHGTPGQAKFHLESRGQRIEPYEEIHARFEAGLGRVLADIPQDQRRTRVDRDLLDRFLFAPDDLVLVVGQDGLVPNVAKYLDGQLVFGINPDPERYDGVLCPHPAASLLAFLAWLERPDDGFCIQARAMALAEREDGQRLLALNEIFVGHHSHQSARYRIHSGDVEERQSSSGLICATGTGATGWARSIQEQCLFADALPEPEESRLWWAVREAFPSVSTGTELRQGSLKPGGRLELFSEMGEGGIAFADGIEGDNLPFLDGHQLSIQIAPQRLNLVMPGGIQ